MSINFYNDQGAGAVFENSASGQSFAASLGYIHATPPNQPAPATPYRLITKLAFRNRFTPSEKVAIEIAQIDNPQASIAARSQAASLRASQTDSLAAEHINLDRPDTRAGVQQLEAAGLLASGRALIILDAPIQAHETYQP